MTCCLLDCSIRNEYFEAEQQFLWKQSLGETKPRERAFHGIFQSENYDYNEVICKRISARLLSALCHRITISILVYFFIALCDRAQKTFLLILWPFAALIQKKMCGQDRKTKLVSFTICTFSTHIESIESAHLWWHTLRQYCMLLCRS